MLLILFSMYYGEYKSFTNVKAVQDDREKYYIITFNDDTRKKILKRHWKIYSIDKGE